MEFEQIQTLLKAGFTNEQIMELNKQPEVVKENLSDDFIETPNKETNQESSQETKEVSQTESSYREEINSLKDEIQKLTKAIHVNNLQTKVQSTIEQPKSVEQILTSIINPTRKEIK